MNFSSFFYVNFQKKIDIHPKILYYIQDLRITLIFGGKMTYNTEKRAELLGFLESNADAAFSIEEICARLTADGKGKSTLYRQTAKLVEEGYVSRIPTGSRKFVYQYRDKQHCGEHLHLKCLDCGRLLHLNAKASASLEKDLLSGEGFSLDSRCILYGKCRDCNLK